MNIAIVGAGIGGLATAILLERLGHRISLFEQFRKPVPIGSGLMIQPVGLEVLELAGVADVVLKHATPIKRVLGRSSQTGRRVLDVDYGAVPGLGIHRAALFSALTGIKNRSPLGSMTTRSSTSTYSCNPPSKLYPKAAQDAAVGS